MGFLKKRIILKNESSDLTKGMAVLTLEQTGAGVYGNLKVYDLNNENDLILGVSSNGKEIYKNELLMNSRNTFDFKITKDIDINDNICAVIVKKCHESVKALVWGSNNNRSEYKEDLINSFRPKPNKDISFDSVEVYNSKVVSDNKIDKDEISFINEKAKLFEADDEEVEDLIDEEMIGDDFYALIKNQLDELFSKFPADEKLSELIPDSKWVRVDYENNGKEYVVGLIYEENKVKYICYGVPSKFGDELPEDLKEFSQWLPIEGGEEGFYLMFQDALTGDSVRLA